MGQNLKSAAKFYEDKVKELNDNLKELEAVVQQKQVNVRTIEEGKLEFHDVGCVIFANGYSPATQDDGCSTTSWSAGCSGINGIESKVLQIVSQHTFLRTLSNKLLLHLRVQNVLHQHDALDEFLHALPQAATRIRK